MKCQKENHNSRVFHVNKISRETVKDKISLKSIHFPLLAIRKLRNTQSVWWVGDSRQA